MRLWYSEPVRLRCASAAHACCGGVDGEAPSPSSSPSLQRLTPRSAKRRRLIFLRLWPGGSRSSVLGLWRRSRPIYQRRHYQDRRCLYQSTVSRRRCGCRRSRYHLPHRHPIPGCSSRLTRMVMVSSTAPSSTTSCASLHRPRRLRGSDRSSCLRSYCHARRVRSPHRCSSHRHLCHRSPCVHRPSTIRKLEPCPPSVL